MLNPSEKAYVSALRALKRKDYRVAVDAFERAAPHFEENAEFMLLWETTRTLVALKEELGRYDSEAGKNELEIEEVFSDGQETEFRR